VECRGDYERLPQSSVAFLCASEEEWFANGLKEAQRVAALAGERRLG